MDEEYMPSRAHSRPAPRNRHASPPGSADWPEPWVQIKYFTFHPNVFPNMIAAASAGAKRGDVVSVYDRDGQPFGHGFFNPGAKVPLRIFRHGTAPLELAHFEQAIRAAVALRLEVLRLPEKTDAFRAIHSDGDGIPGLMV